MGLAVAKAGLERLSPATTTLCVIAANAPDGDILATIGGRWSYLHHHRGITHSIVGTLALALILPSLVYLGDLILARMRRRATRIKFRGLLLASLMASATHPLMDWTNNYGMRPLLPWSGQWFYGDLVFILDPWLWLILGGAAFLLTAQTNWRIALWTVLALILTAAILFLPQRRADVYIPVVSRALWACGLIGLVAAHRWGLARRWGRVVAVAALALVVVYWGALSLLHRRALSQTEAVASNLASGYGETLRRTAAMPTLANPLRWQGMAETDRATYRFFLSLNDDGREFPGRVRFEKQQGDAARAVERAAADYRARVFLEFARFPVFQVEGDCASQLLVQLADLRYTEPGATRSGSFALELPVACPEERTAVSETK
jgi:inner membrane protein